MKIKSLLLTSAIFALSLASCSNDDDNGSKWDGNPVLFNTTVEGSVTSKAKASDNTWDDGDAIGVFMKKGAGLDGVVDGATNKKYTTAGSGAFSPANPATDAIYFPEDGSNVDFIAYYPYAATLAANTYKVDVTTQTSQEDIDLLYSDNAAGLNKNSSDVTLNFKHQLAKVVFTINAGNGITDLTGLVVTITGTNTKADYALATGVLSNEGTKANIIAKTTISGAQATSEAIVIPMDGMDGRKVTFAIPAGIFTWDVPSTEKFEKGKKNTYTVELKKGGGTSVYPSGTIEDWGPGSSEHIVIDLGEGGDGTQASPYTISQLSGKVGETGKWVTGYIVGSTSKTKAVGTPSTENILLAATAGETNEANCIPVDISSSAVKANLDIVANSDLIGKQVKVQGDIVNTIFQNTLSMTNIVAQEGGKTGGGDEELNFEETFGPTWRAGETTTLTKKWDEYIALDQFDMKAPIVYSTGSDPVDFRSTKSYDNPHVWFAANYNKSLKIEGIEGGYKTMKLTYDVAGNKAQSPANGILVKCNNIDVTVPSTNLGDANAFTTMSIDIPDGTTTVEFYSTPASNPSGFGYRIDNIKITGKK